MKTNKSNKTNVDTSCFKTELEDPVVGPFQFKGQEVNGCRQCFERRFRNYKICCEKRLKEDIQYFIGVNELDEHKHCKICLLAIDTTSRDFRYFPHGHCIRCDSTSYHVHCWVKSCNYEGLEDIEKCLHFHCPDCKKLIRDYKKKITKSYCNCGPIDWNRFDLYGV